MMLNLTVCFDLAHLKGLREKKGAKYIKSPTLYGLSTQTLVEQQGIISKRIKKNTVYLQKIALCLQRIVYIWKGTETGWPGGRGHHLALDVVTNQGKVTLHQ